MHCDERKIPRLRKFRRSSPTDIEELVSSPPDCRQPKKQRRDEYGSAVEEPVPDPDPDPCSGDIGTEWGTYSRRRFITKL